VTTNRQKKTRNHEKDNSRGTASGRRSTSRTSGSGTSGGGSSRQNIISIFILFHLIAITSWALPWNAPVVRDVKELVRPYLLWTGLFQTWDMFSPNPKSVNAYVKAIVITSDRHMKVWSFPRMEELGFGERYTKERYRKFVEDLLDQKNEGLWPDVANHVARQFNNPIDPPDKVMLIQFQTDIKPWADKSYNPVPEPNVFYEEYVQPGDLR
jgi:hypothetical protein